MEAGQCYAVGSGPGVLLNLFFSLILYSLPPILMISVINFFSDSWSCVIKELDTLLPESSECWYYLVERFQNALVNILDL